jgi:predicted component of type VI protein secretion system
VDRNKPVQYEAPAAGQNWQSDVSMAKLIFSGDKFRGRVYEFTLEKTTVGRGDHNTLAIHDPSVSHTHCEILVYGEEVIVRDLGSSNGTFVRGGRLHHQQRPVNHGDVVAFGDVEARLELDDRSESGSATDFTAVHDYAEYLRERQQGKPKTPADASLKLGTAPDDATADRTVVLSPPPQARPATKPEAARQNSSQDKPLSRFPWVFVLAAVLMGLVLGLWLLFRNH